MKPWMMLVAFIIVSLALCGHVTPKKRRIPQWHIKMAQSQGPNACAVEEIPGTGKQLWTECRYWLHRKICGRKTVIRYECCEGYDRIPEHKGCTAAKPLRSILETAEDLGATRFAQYMRDAGLSDQLSHEGAFTLFAPVNSVFENLTPAQIQRLRPIPGGRGSPLLHFHMLDHKLHSKHLDADQLVETMDQGQPLRINKFSNGMLTANCVPIVRKDQEATNGVVHLVEGLLEPAVPTNLVDTLSADSRFTHLSDLIGSSDVLDTLRRSGPFSIVAPYDEAFQKIPALKLERIKADRHARKALVQAHIVPHSLCLPAIIDKHKVRTTGEGEMELECNETGAYADNAKMTGEYIVTSNGVVHPIGDVFIPQRAKTVFELAEETGELDTFLELAAKAGLEDTLGSGGSFTVFAPSDQAFQEIPVEELRRIATDSRAARETVMSHMVHGQFTFDRVHDGQRVPCMDGRNSLRLKVYRKGFGVEAAMVKTADMVGLNGALHVIDRVVVLPKSNILDQLAQDGNFSIMLEGLQKVRQSDPDVLKVRDEKGGEGSVTFFAPPDEAFRKLNKATLERVMNDPAYLTKVIKNHIADNMIASRSFHSKLRYNLKTKEDTVEVRRKHEGIQVGGARVSVPDIVTTDGIVHVVDRVLLPVERYPVSDNITEK